jgi:putative MATE family efflux protein
LATDTLFSRSFIKTVLAIAIPISIQNLAQASVGFIDTAMVAQLGEVSLGAIGLSQQIGFFVIVATLGLASGGGVLITRYWGAGQLDAIRSITTITALFSVTFASLIGILSVFHAVDILMFLSSGNAQIAQAGRAYLQITAFGFPISALTISLAIQLRCVNKSQYPMYMSLISLPIAILFNYLLIYGHLGFPALGATGAAIATLLTRLIELGLTLIFFASHRNPVWSGKWRAFTDVFSASTRGYVTNAFLKLALPITAMELLWVTGQFIYKISFAYFGSNALAAYTVYENIVNLFNVGFIGLGNTAAILIGQQIGSGDIDKAKLFARNFIKLNFIIFIPVGILLLYLSPMLVQLFILTGYAADYLKVALILAGILLSLKSLNFLLMVGILRAGGDARFIAISTAIAMSISLGLTYWVVFVDTKNFYWVLFIIIGEENCRNLLSLARYKSRRWLKYEATNPITTIT